MVQRNIRVQRDAGRLLWEALLEPAAGSASVGEQRACDGGWQHLECQDQCVHCLWRSAPRCEPCSERSPSSLLRTPRDRCAPTMRFRLTFFHEDPRVHGACLGCPGASAGPEQAARGAEDILEIPFSIKRPLFGWASPRFRFLAAACSLLASQAEL